MALLSNKYKQLPPQDIIVPKGRQRQEDFDTSDLEPSVAARGIYNPIIITQGLELVAGERRLRTALKLGLATVPVRFDGDLSPLERKIVELEENERRKDLFWKDQVRAITQLHGLYGQLAEAEGKDWSLTKTAEMLFYTQPTISKMMRVAQDLDSPRIAEAPGLAAAYNILSRLDERRIGDAMSSITEAGLEMAEAPAKAALQAAQRGGSTGQALPATPKIPDPSETILQENFIQWAEAYTGTKFNFVHCDFPFGVNLFEGEQGGKNKWTGYDDDPNVYWQLIRAFCKHRDRFMAASAHLMFWFSMDFYSETLELFSKLAPELRFHPKPLIWHKTDNVGVLADPKRWPRHIYETALIASRENRPIIQATSDVYGAPTNKEHHPSTKPEPMLRYFMQMFVDEHTTMLDPTCGSGAAVRAAESRGAKATLGLELSAEHCQNARSALRQFRAKQRLAKLGGHTNG